MSPPVFDDGRPWFAVFVTGRADLIPAGVWTASPLIEHHVRRPDAYPLVKYLDAALWRKRQTHRVALYCRSEDTGVDQVVRAYAKLRLGRYQLATPERDVFGAQARFRRDLATVARCNALVWYGPREDPAEHGPDPVTIAAALGIEYRVVPFPAPDREEGV